MKIPCAAVLFDWDGTLVDTLERKARGGGALVARAVGADPHDGMRAFLRHSGIPRRQLFDAIARDLSGRALTEDEYASLSAAFTAQNATIGPDAVFDDARAALPLLAERGLALYVSSSAVQEEITLGVQRTGLAPLFVRALGSAPGFGKGPEHVAAVAREVGVPVHACCHVGDDAADVRLARAAGCRIVRKVREGEDGSPAGDANVKDLRELLEILVPG